MKEGIERIVKFKTEDGTLHDTYAAAQRHKSEQDFIVWCEENLPANSRSDAQEIAQVIRQNWNVSRKNQLRVKNVKQLRKEIN